MEGESSGLEDRRIEIHKNSREFSKADAGGAARPAHAAARAIAPAGRVGRPGRVPGFDESTAQSNQALYHRAMPRRRRTGLRCGISLGSWCERTSKSQRNGPIRQSDTDSRRRFRTDGGGSARAARRGARGGAGESGSAGLIPAAGTREYGTGDGPGARRSVSPVMRCGARFRISLDTANRVPRYFRM